MGFGGGLATGDRVGKADMRTDQVVGENTRTGGDKITIDITTIIMVIEHSDITTITITTITIKEMIHLQTGEDMTPIITTITITDSKEETVMIMTTITTITTITKTLETDKTDSFPTTTTMTDNNNEINKLNKTNQTPQGAYH